MPKLKLFLLSLIIFTQAYMLEIEEVTNKMMLKGKIDSHHVEYLTLPFDAKIKALQPYGQIVSKNEPLFSIEYLSESQGLSQQILAYLLEEQAFAISNQHTKTQQELLKIGAISHKAFHETKLEHEKKLNALYMKAQSLEKILDPYDLSISSINQLENISLENIERFVKTHIPNLLYSPISGILLPVSKDLHANIFKQYAYIAKIVDDQAFEIQLTVSEKQLGELSIGQIVSIKIPSIDKTLSGEVFNINPYPANEGSRSTYAVSVRVNQDQNFEDIHLGMSGIVNIELSKKQVLLVPITAVQSIADKHMVILSDSKSLREITLGQTYGDKIEVKTGLSAGEEILEHYSN